MVGFVKVLLCAVAATALVQKRDFPAVTSDLTTINISVRSLSASIAAYTASTIDGPALSVDAAAAALQSQIAKTTTDTNNTPGPVTETQAQTVCDYFSGTLIPSIKAAFNLLVAKRGQFKSAGLGAAVNGRLTSLSSSAQALATALISKAPAAKKSCASSASSAVISLFNSAISGFNAA